MRLLIAFGYVILHVARLWLHKRAISISPARVQAAGRLEDVAHINTWLHLAGTVILFAQFYLLTGIFPTLLLTAFAIVNVLTAGGSFFLRARFGLDTPDTTRKTKTLSFIFGLTIAQPVKILLIPLSLLVVLWPIAVLWLYFTNPALPPDVVATLAIFHFFIPACLTQVTLPLTAWHLMTSPDVDDDPRIDNFLDLTAFSVNNIVFALYPVYLIVHSGALAQSAISVGVLLSVPVLLYVAGCLLPFVAGTYRYRAVLESRVAWRRKWISEMMSVMKLPAADTTVREARRLTAAIDRQITDSFTRDRLFRSLQQDWSNLPAAPPEAVQPAALAEPAGGAEVATRAATIPARTLLGMSEPDRVELRQQVRFARDALRGALGQGVTTQKDIRSILQQERESLVEWNSSFAFLSELLDLREATVDYNQRGLQEYLRSKQAQADDASKRSGKAQGKGPWLLSIIATGVSSLLLWVFNNYESDILGFVGKVIAVAGK